MLPTHFLKNLALLALITSLVFGANTSFAKEDNSPLECDGEFKGQKEPTEKQLEQILREHKKWVETRKNDGKRANLCDADLFQYNLTGVQLQEANLTKADLADTNLTGADLQGANLTMADLDQAILIGASLEKANLTRANLDVAKLNKARLREANMEQAILNDADLKEASLYDANLSRTMLLGTILPKEGLAGANLNKADISGVNLDGIKLKLKPDGIPLIPSFAATKNLKELAYVNPPHSLVEIRNGLKKAGMREQERVLTYVIKHGWMNQAIDKEWEKDKFWETLQDKIEAYFSWLFFDITSDWGMAPGRPLWILGFLVLLFTIPYSFVIKRKYLF